MVVGGRAFPFADGGVRGGEEGGEERVRGEVVCWVGPMISHCQKVEGGEGQYTRRMRSLKNPKRVFRVGDYLVPPFDLEVARGFFAEGRAGEGVDV